MFESKFGETPASLNPNRARPLRRVAVGLAGATLVLAGCSVVSDKDSSMPTPSVSVDADPLALFSSPYGECDPATVIMFPDSEVGQEAAEDCLDVYADADIAFVNYALSEEDAEHLAVETEGHLAMVTDGMINADITVVPASEVAIELFEEENPYDCVSTPDIESYSSYVAAATMPELETYDKVIGITNAVACEAGIAGVAYPTYNRYAEVFSAADDIQRVKENGGEYTDILSEKDGITTSVSLPNTALIAAHEILHGFGLGHAGRLSSQAVEGGSFGDIGQYIEARTGQQIDLAQFIAAGNYSEYGAYNVMGTPSELREGMTLDEPQKYVLEWPLRELGKETELNISNLEDGALTFSQQAIDTSHAAMITFNEPLPMPRSTSSVSELSEYEKFSQLIITPGYEEDGSVWSIDMKLLGDKASSVDIGKMYKIGTYQFAIGGQTLVVDLTGKTASLTLQ